MSRKLPDGMSRYQVTERVSGQSWLVVAPNAGQASRAMELILRQKASDASIESQREGGPVLWPANIPEMDLIVEDYPGREKPDYIIQGEGQ